MWLPDLSKITLDSVILGWITCGIAYTIICNVLLNTVERKTLNRWSNTEVVVITIMAIAMGPIGLIFCVASAWGYLHKRIKKIKGDR